MLGGNEEKRENFICKFLHCTISAKIVIYLPVADKIQVYEDFTP